MESPPAEDATSPPLNDRPEHPYIDTSNYDSDDLSLPEESDHDASGIDDEYDVNRVGDEDWENAERGPHLFFLCGSTLSDIGGDRLYKTVQSATAACCRSSRKCARNFLSHQPIFLCCRTSSSQPSTEYDFHTAA